MVLDHYRFGRIRSRVRAVRVCQKLTTLELIYLSQFGSESDESENRGAGGWLIPAALNPVVSATAFLVHFKPFSKVFLPCLLSQGLNDAPLCCFGMCCCLAVFAAWLCTPAWLSLVEARASRRCLSGEPSSAA